MYFCGEFYPNHEGMSDQELLEAISHKDVNAFNQLYHRYNKLLFKKACIRVQDIVQAEEIMQDFWIDIWKQPSRIKSNQDGEAKGFLFNYLFFRILDFIRKEGVNVIALANNETLERVENELSYTHISEEYDIKELETVISGILKELPGKMDEIFMLRYRDGYTIKETAEMLNINERTVKYRSKECIAALKKIMEKEGIDITSFKVLRDVSSSVVYIVFMADKIIS